MVSWIVLQLISRFCATQSAIGCTRQCRTYTHSYTNSWFSSIHIQFLSLCPCATKIHRLPLKLPSSNDWALRPEMPVIPDPKVPANARSASVMSVIGRSSSSSDPFWGRGAEPISVRTTSAWPSRAAWCIALSIKKPSIARGSARPLSNLQYGRVCVRHLSRQSRTLKKNNRLLEINLCKCAYTRTTSSCPAAAALFFFGANALNTPEMHVTRCFVESIWFEILRTQTKTDIDTYTDTHTDNYTDTHARTYTYQTQATYAMDAHHDQPLHLDLHRA